MTMEKATVELIDKLKKLSEDEECKWLSGDSSLSLNDIYLIRESCRCIKTYKDALDDTHCLIRTLSDVFGKKEKHVEKPEESCSNCRYSILVYTYENGEAVKHRKCLGENVKDEGRCRWWKGSE